MKSALEQCIEQKACRFIVYGDSTVALQDTPNGRERQIQANANPWLEEAQMAGQDARVMCQNLVPEDIKAQWALALSVVADNGRFCGIFTPVSLQLPPLEVAA